MKKYLFTLLLFIIFFLKDMIWERTFLGQCAMCKAVVENNQTNNYGIEKMGTGVNSGIFLLILFVYLFWFFAFRKKVIPFLKEMMRIHRK
jgi:hypothetical protein